MGKSKVADLEARISELEAEVADREQDLAKYREQLGTTNVKLEKLIAQLQQELKIAHAVQKTLVPTEFPHMPGFEFSSKFVPSRVSGGDYFDIFEHEDRMRFGLIVASSSGPALSALFLSVLLKWTGQMEARRGAEPHNVLNSMLKELVEQMADNHRADIFYGLFDRRRFELNYCRVGEVVALHYSHSSGELKLLEVSAPTVTPEFAKALESRTLALNPNDKLICCTRGVIESVNLAGEPFGIERLSKVVLSGSKSGVHELRNQVLYELQKFTSGQEPPRDLTIVVIEVKDRVIKLAKN